MTNHRPPSWFPLAREMQSTGASLTKIGKAVKVDRTTVKRWFDRIPMGTALPENTEPLPLVPTEKVEAALRMKAEGVSWPKIADALGEGRYRLRMAVDPVFIERTRKKQEEARELRKHGNPDWRRCAPEPERPRASASVLADGRFARPQDRRYGR